MNRRSLLLGLSGLIAAPAVLRLGAHMPVRRVEAAPKIFGVDYASPGGMIMAIRTKTGWHASQVRIAPSLDGKFTMDVPSAMRGLHVGGLALCDRNMNPLWVYGVSPGLTAVELAAELRPTGG